MVNHVYNNEGGMPNNECLTMPAWYQASYLLEGTTTEPHHSNDGSFPSLQVARAELAFAITDIDLIVDSLVAVFEGPSIAQARLRLFQVARLFISSEFRNQLPGGDFEDMKTIRLRVIVTPWRRRRTWHFEILLIASMYNCIGSHSHGCHGPP